MVLFYKYMAPLFAIPVNTSSTALLSGASCMLSATTCTQHISWCYHIPTSKRVHVNVSYLNFMGAAEAHYTTETDKHVLTVSPLAS